MVVVVVCRFFVVGVDVVVGMVVVAVVGYCNVINVGVVVTVFLRVDIYLF